MVKSRKSYSLIVFIILLLIIFISLNITANLLGSSRKLDMTDGQRYSLSPATEKIIEQLKAPVYIRVYLSNNLVKENPQYSNFALFVLRFLKKYQQAAGADKIKIEVLNPEPYSSLEDEAKKAGLKAIPDSSGQSNLYFGALFSNATGNNHVIPNFLPSRSGYLENDLSRILAKINSEKHPVVGLVSPVLPLISRQYGKVIPNWAIMAQLQNDYKVVGLSDKIARIPANIDVLMVINLPKLTPLFTYALDQYILRGGKLLIINDAYSEKQAELFGSQNAGSADLNRLSQNWGFELDNQNVVGERSLGEILLINDGTNTQAKNFPFWMVLNKAQINWQNSITSGLKHIRVKTPGFISSTGKNTRATFTPLLSIEKNGGQLPVKDVMQQSQSELSSLFRNNNHPYTLAALVEGKFDSLFTGSIVNEKTPEQMQAYLPSSIAPAKIIAVADSDLIVAENWADTSETLYNPVYGLAPVYDNGGFILRAVDFLAGKTELLGLNNKETNNSKTVGEAIYSDIFNRHAPEYNLLQQELQIRSQAMQTVEHQLADQKLSLSADTMETIEQNRKGIQHLQQQLKQTEYQIKQENEAQINSIIRINSFFIPLAIIIFLAAFYLYRKHRQSKRVKEIFL